MKGSFFSAITSFTRSLFSEDLFYFESRNYTIVFSRGQINSCDSICTETLIAYAVLQNGNCKKTDKIVEKKIKPKLNLMLEKFHGKFNGKNLSSLNLFDSFGKELEGIKNH